MLDFGLGELALHPDVFWDLTYAEFERLAAGYQRRELEKYRRARLSGRIAAEEFPLPGDDLVPDSPASALSDEDYAAELERLDALP